MQPVFSGVKGQGSSSFNPNLGIPCLHGAGFVRTSIVMLQDDLGILVPVKAIPNATAYRVVLDNYVLTTLRKRVG